MKSLAFTPVVAALMLSTAAVAQTTTPAPAETPAPPAAAEPAPVPNDTSVMPAPADLPSTTADSATAPVLSDDQAAALKDKVVWSSDQKNVGEVAEIVRDSSGRVTELQADIGGFLGFGETRVRVAPDEFKLENDRVVLTRTSEQTKNLPKVIAN